jgi:hypothetical protein
MPEHKRALNLFALVVITAGCALSASAQRPDPVTLTTAQREAMKPLAVMNGVWRGPAWTVLASGQKHNVTQTERIGPFLDGSINVIEGRGYNEDGTVGFTPLGSSPTIR